MSDKDDVNSVSVIIPAFNEQEKITATVKAVASIPGVEQVIVADDGSTDDTARLAEAAGAQVVKSSRNLGKGGVLNFGLSFASCDIIALVDADLGDTASEVAKLIKPVMEGSLDMSIARFPKAQRKGGFGLLKGMARLGIKLFTGLEMVSPISGQRVMRKVVLERIGGIASGWGAEVGLTIDAARRGFRIGEVEVMMTHSETGRDINGFIHRGKQFKGVAFTLVSRLFRR